MFLQGVFIALGGLGDWANLYFLGKFFKIWADFILGNILFFSGQKNRKLIISGHIFTIGQHWFINSVPIKNLPSHRVPHCKFLMRAKWHFHDMLDVKLIVLFWFWTFLQQVIHIPKELNWYRIVAPSLGSVSRTWERSSRWLDQFPHCTSCYCCSLITERN